MNNKKIFQISADFDLNKKPGWMDDFRSKYDKPYSYHVTLKNSTYFNEKGFKSIKKELSKIANKYNIIEIAFDKLFLSNSPKGECVMIESKHNEKLEELQKEISHKFSKYGKHIFEEFEEFERNFRPHITIARYLTPGQMKNAKKELGENLKCEALIDKLVLTTVNNDIFEEWSNPENKFIIKLHREK